MVRTTQTGVNVAPEKLAPHLKPELTVLPIFGGQGTFYVAGRIHDGLQNWYWCWLGDDRHCPTCECTYHEKKLRGTRRLCAHLQACKEFVERGRQAETDAAVRWWMSLTDEQRRAIWR